MANCHQLLGTHTSLFPEKGCSEDARWLDPGKNGPKSLTPAIYVVFALTGAKTSFQDAIAGPCFFSADPESGPVRTPMAAGSDGDWWGCFPISRISETQGYTKPKMRCAYR